MGSIIASILGLVAGIVVAVAYPYQALAINNVVMQLLDNAKVVIIHILS